MSSATLKWGGPFHGYVSSVPTHKAPPDAMVPSGQNALVNPFDGSIYPRMGQTIQGDTLSSNIEVTGLLETKFSGRGRHMAELYSQSASDGLPMPSALVTAEGNSAYGSYPDTGWFGAHYHRDIAAAVNYVLGSEYSSTHYPSAGGLGNNELDHKWVPLWCQSGDGLYNRGAFAFARSLLFGGSRSFVDAGNYRYHPSLYGTPSKWNRRYNTATNSGTEPNRLFPSGNWGPLYPPTVASGTASTGSDAVWADGDYFYVSVIFQMEDGSFTAPFLPRAINTRLSTGLGAVTIGSTSGTSKYRNVVWSNIPKGPDGTIARVLLRSPKQNISSGFSHSPNDVLTISFGDLRITGILRNNTQTSYVDTLGTDTGLLIDTNTVRFDGVLPRRARHIGTGDQRVLIGYSLPNPCAIMIAPTAKNSGTTRQLNGQDTDLSTWLGSFSMLMRITCTAGGDADQMELHYIAGSSGAPNSTNFAFSTYTTLQDLVDAINGTTTAGTGGEWVAALAPGIDGSIASTCLAPTVRAVNTVKCSNGSATLTNGDFSRVAVGMKISDGTANFPAGTYVLSKQSSTSITMSQQATATDNTGHTATFYCDCGDEANVTGGTHGYVRAFCPAIPVVAYLATQYQVGYDRIDKQSVYFTVSSPGAQQTGVSLAPNLWVSGNRRTVTAKYGVLQGFADIEQAAVVAYSKAIRLFINQRGVTSGEDFDYRLLTINDKRGCIGSGTLVAGNGWASYWTPQGVVATDKTRREVVLSNDIHNPTTLAGSLNFEINKCIQGSRADDDTGYANCQVFGAQLHMTYRSTGSLPNRRIVYDYGPGFEASGLAELALPTQTGQLAAAFGWSSELTVPPTVMCEVGRTSGLQRYGWRDSNGGATGDGRLQLFDDSGSSAADDGLAITSVPRSPVFVAPAFQAILPRRVQVIQKTPTAAATLTFYRDKKAASGLSRSLSADNAANYIREAVELSVPYRGNSEAAIMTYTFGGEDGQVLWEAILEYDLAASYAAT